MGSPSAHSYCSSIIIFLDLLVSESKQDFHSSTFRTLVAKEEAAEKKAIERKEQENQAKKKAAQRSRAEILLSCGVGWNTVFGQWEKTGLGSTPKPTQRGTLRGEVSGDWTWRTQGFVPFPELVGARFPSHACLEPCGSRTETDGWCTHVTMFQAHVLL